ncbi:restriction endonuclease subunit S [Acinetobacter haemolyticus]|uniref:Restriction endonuclease subunit S n=1 Tax=Acinetobacter haemolyticus TaxID=29430 RepID=A0AAJ2YUM0_ACIHA|nr:restriction endonuclease subunit S [Acinetobacter haemolyticus]NAR18268.1 restriction endonuclease subunit S [Acinetobacter haemolyticus]NAR28927.1 restriction endonuclease subunit S [Acinetobacter haemolyticus]NAR35751.1 restriction endonuclease subunit S [Acinetobacter haemolyticus]NAR46709.1 restriction endonuclease subunit S [Acinetobacter haemolyticus]NAR64736.1 restriction endonuclease subunit S [Acinetobacter haemolyticus]
MSFTLRLFWEAAGGNVPEHWEFKTIDELLEHPKAISVGVMYPGSDTDGGVPLIKVSDVKNGAIASRPSFCISNKVDEEYKRTRLNGSELLLTLVGNPGNCVIVTDEMCGWNVARALAVIRLKDTQLRSWIRYVLASKPAQHLIETRLNTTVQKTLNLKDVREIGIPIPPREERDSITKIIDSIEKKTLLNTQINQTLESIAQAIFKSWFIDFDPVRAKMAAKQEGQDPELAAMCTISGKSEEELQQMADDDFTELQATAALFPDELVESELGEVPKGWEVSTVGEQVQTVGGGTPSTKNVDFWDDGIHYWTTPKDLSNLTDKILLNTERKITDAGLKKISSGLLPKDTVLMSSRAPVGYLALSKIEVAINQGYIAILPNMKYSAEYLIQWCEANMAEIKGRASGTTFQEISKKNFREISFVCPDDKVVVSYTKTVKTLYDEITSKAKENQSLINLRDTLLPKLMSGEISLNKNMGSIDD